MGKSNTKNLVGQPIFRQIVTIITRDKFWVTLFYVPMKNGNMDQTDETDHPTSIFGNINCLRKVWICILTCNKRYEINNMIFFIVSRLIVVVFEKKYIFARFFWMKKEDKNLSMNTH